MQTETRIHMTVNMNPIQVTVTHQFKKSEISGNKIGLSHMASTYIFADSII